MKIIEAGEKEKNLWNSFVLENQGEFLQSWEWGDFQKSTGSPSTSLGARKIWRLAGQGDNGEILGVALIIGQDLLFRRNYLYCPRGPIIESSKFSARGGSALGGKVQSLKFLELFFNKIREIAEKEKSVFLRVESEKETKFPLGNLVSKYNADRDIKPAANIQPKSTLILDITRPEEQLLSEMKQKTRYNIRLAEKRGVKVRVSNKDTFEQDFEKFWSLVEETARRDKFQSHPEDYYRGMIELLSENEKYQNSPAVKLFLAEYKGKILAANIVIFFGERAVYLHGASSSEKRDLMAPHLLQWEQIKAARELGCKEYDFWGISSETPNTKNQAPKKNWEGITRFKKGFGGREVKYPEASDLIYHPVLYKAIEIGKKVKKFFQGAV